MNAKLTKGNADDRSVVPQMTVNMKGFLFADKGYISKDLFLRLMSRGLKIITGIKCTMKNVLMSFEEKVLLRKRSLVEIKTNLCWNTLGTGLLSICSCTSFPRSLLTN